MPPLNHNQVLRDRKIKERKVGDYRAKRIAYKYRQQMKEPEAPQDPTSQRQLKYYEKVFKKEEKPAVERVPKREENVFDGAEKTQQLKQKKRKLVKKMKTQKTSKGQPLMRNYIKYALANLQLDLEKEKAEKKESTGKNGRTKNVL